MLQATQISKVRQQVVLDPLVQYFLDVLPKVEGDILPVFDQGVLVYELENILIVRVLEDLDVSHGAVKDVPDLGLQVDCVLLEKDVSDLPIRCVKVVIMA